jgi:hypothetical protein
MLLAFPNDDGGFLHVIGPPPSILPPEFDFFKTITIFITLIGAITTGILAVRADRRAVAAELRAQEKHDWEKADRARSDDGTVP